MRTVVVISVAVVLNKLMIIVINYSGVTYYKLLTSVVGVVDVVAVVSLLLLRRR